MKRLVLLVVMLATFITMPIGLAQADWRWKTPHFKVKVKPVCSTSLCHQAARAQKKAVLKAKIKYFNSRKLAEWRTWTKIPIPRCSWYGESGYGPEYARYRYTMPNSGGSGALGKYQFMPNTYIASGKYDDWSPLDQEIAARREYWKHGTGPWTNC